jgi:indolepyruvate ferredoxin oxidoreductase, beta subunit
MDIYITGVGGQGIGLLSEIILRAADHAGLKVIGVDTHGLAQRGGIVVSRIRTGENAHSPLIMQHQADLVVALERHEALRGAVGFLKDGGTLIYYDAVWQPLDVRLGNADEVARDVILRECRDRGIEVLCVLHENLESARMQNIVLLAHICRHNLISNIFESHFLKAMDDLMEGDMLEKNRDVFVNEIKAGQGT